MRESYILAGAVVATVLGVYGASKIIGPVKPRQTSIEPAERSYNTQAAKVHLNNAIRYLTCEHNDREICFFGIEALTLSASDNAKPARARKSLELALQDLPPAQAIGVRKVYEDLPDTPVSNDRYDKHCEMLQAFSDSLP